MSLLTGSRAYGEPRDDSDIDLVVLMTEEDLAKLKPLGTVRPMSGDYGARSESCSIYFGNLNLIVVTKPDAYMVWVKGTNHLIDQAPVTRDHAVATFRTLEAEMYEQREQNANSQEN